MSEPFAPLKLLTASLGGERLGIPIARIQTIFEIASVTRVPLGPPELVGLVNLRGTILPALDLARHLGTTRTAASAGSLAIAIDDGADAFAILVDEVGDVIDVDGADALSVPPHVPQPGAGLIAAVHRVPDGVVPVLDLSALLPRLEAGRRPEGRSPPERDHTRGGAAA